MDASSRPEPYVPTTRERRGAALAHGAGLVIGVPLIIVGYFIAVPLAFAYLIVPFLVYYAIARPFRNRRVPWGAFQGMQAAVIHLGIALLLLSGHLLGPVSRPGSFLFMVAVLLFLYSIWAAWDTLLGEDFRYIGINKLLYRVSQSNLTRRDRRRGYIRSYRERNDDQQPRQ